MLFPSKKEPPVGVDIGSHYVKIVQLNPIKTGFELKAFGMQQLEPDTIVEDNIEKPEVVVEAIKTLLSTEKIKARNAATALPGRSVVIKKISLPASSEYDVGELLNIEAEQYIPFEVSEAALDYHLITEERQEEEEASQREVLMVAAQREKVDNYKTLISQAGLNPLVVDVDTFAFENGYELNYGVEENTVIALIDIGAAFTTVNILEHGLTAFTRDVNYAGDIISYAIRDELDVSLDMAEQLKTGVEVKGFSPLKIKAILVNALEELCAEVKNAFDLYREASEREVDKISLTGGTARITGIDRFMSQNIGVPLQIADPFKNIKVDDKVFDPQYIEYVAPMAAVGVGLATRKFGDKEEGPKAEKEG